MQPSRRPESSAAPTWTSSSRRPSWWPAAGGWAAASYAAAFGAFAESGAYDVLAIVHDFPYRSLPSEIETASEVTDQLLRATEDRPELLPVYISLTSGEPPAETKAQLDAAGGVPILRGA